MRYDDVFAVDKKRRQEAANGSSVGPNKNSHDVRRELKKTTPSALAIKEWPGNANKQWQWTQSLDGAFWSFSSAWSLCLALCPMVVQLISN